MRKKKRIRQYSLYFDDVILTSLIFTIIHDHMKSYDGYNHDEKLTPCKKMFLFIVVPVKSEIRIVEDDKRGCDDRTQ